MTTDIFRLFVVITIRCFPHSSLITSFVTPKSTTMGVYVEQELLTLPEHLSSPPVFSGVRVTRSLVFCVMYWMFVLLSLHCLSFLDLRLLVDFLTFLNHIYPRFNLFVNFY